MLYGSYAHGPSIAPPAGARRSWPRCVRIGASGRGCCRASFSARRAVRSRNRFARFQRLATSADTAAALLEQVYRNDVRDQLALVKAPTLIVHRRGDRAIPYPLGREVAAGIRGARLVPLEGTAHFPWAGDADSVVRAMRAVLTVEGEPERPAGEPAAVLLSRREREVLGLVAIGSQRPRDRRPADREPAHGASPRGEHPSQAGPRISDGGSRRSCSTRSALNPRRGPSHPQHSATCLDDPDGPSLANGRFGRCASAGPRLWSPA